MFSYWWVSSQKKVNQQPTRARVTASNVEGKMGDTCRGAVSYIVIIKITPLSFRTSTG
jgi:hypothetical protein